MRRAANESENDAPVGHEFVVARANLAAPLATNFHSNLA